VRVQVILVGLDGLNRLAGLGALNGHVYCGNHLLEINACPPFIQELLQSRHAVHAVNHRVLPFYGGLAQTYVRIL
jgi:hypothetical protein